MLWWEEWELDRRREEAEASTLLPVAAAESLPTPEEKLPCDAQRNAVRSILRKGTYDRKTLEDYWRCLEPEDFPPSAEVEVSESVKPPALSNGISCEPKLFRVLDLAEQRESYEFQAILRSLPKKEFLSGVFDEDVKAWVEKDGEDTFEDQLRRATDDLARCLRERRTSPYTAEVMELPTAEPSCASQLEMARVLVRQGMYSWNAMVDYRRCLGYTSHPYPTDLSKPEVMWWKPMQLPPTDAPDPCLVQASELWEVIADPAYREFLETMKLIPFEELLKGTFDEAQEAFWLR
jgi:hypothetical protein